MLSGKQDRVISFQRKGEEVDNGHERVPGDWADIAGAEAVPAMFKPGMGSERFANAQNAATAPSVYWVRYMPALADLSPLDRIVDATRVYDIKSVKWDGRTTSQIEIAVVEGVVGGK